MFIPLDKPFGLLFVKYASWIDDIAAPLPKTEWKNNDVGLSLFCKFCYITIHLNYF